MTQPDYRERVFRWAHVKDREEIEAFYLGIIPQIRKAARENGYAIGVHGSLRRDLDLVAVPWIEQCADKDQLARAIQQAACGTEMQSYRWEQKPLGRMAVSFPVCFPEWNEPNVGHIDLSVVSISDAHLAGRREGSADGYRRGIEALKEIMAVVNEQAQDEGLWSVRLDGTQTIAEAYLQQELRRLHAVIERALLRGGKDG